MASPEVQLEKRGAAAEGKSLLGAPVAVWMRLRSAWLSMPTNRRKSASVAVLLLAALLGLSLWYGIRTDWRTLYSSLDAEDARQVGILLTQAQIPFELTDNGLTLRVPSTQLDKARLATSGKALKSGRLGFELFDKPNWMGSEFDEQVNYQRALEGELEHTIASLSDVEVARVHLVMLHDSLFRDQQRPAKASVVLRLRRASLGEGEADSIRNLVASAVDGLSPEHVVLVDASGRLRLGPKTADALRLETEQSLEEKLIATLEPVTGAGNVRASVSLDYDPDLREETSESYDPTQSATLSMERTEQTNGDTPVPSGVPGTASNAPNAQALPVYPRRTAASQSSKTESGTYGVSKTVRHKIENPGKIRRLTVAVVVNDRMITDSVKGHPSQWQARSADELRNLTTLAQAAVGFDGARGDLVTVQNMSFDDNRAGAPQGMPAQLLSKVQASPELVKSGCLLLGTAILVFFGVRPALRQLLLGAKQAGTYLPERAEPMQQLVQAEKVTLPDPNRVRNQEIFDRVSRQVKDEPTQSSRLLQSWIHSE